MEILLFLIYTAGSVYFLKAAYRIRHDRTYLLPTERINLRLSKKRMDKEMFDWYKERLLSPEKRKRVASHMEAGGGLSAFMAILMLFGIALKIYMNQ